VRRRLGRERERETIRKIPTERQKDSFLSKIINVLETVLFSLNNLALLSNEQQTQKKLYFYFRIDLIQTGLFHFPSI
jgi:hypothetical protein